MEAKLDKEGRLLLERKGKFKMQFCPLDSTSNPAPCGDWCSLFSEEGFSINVCNNRQFLLVIDERDYGKDAKEE